MPFTEHAVVSFHFSFTIKILFRASDWSVTQGSISNIYSAACRQLNKCPYATYSRNRVGIDFESFPREQKNRTRFFLRFDPSLVVSLIANTGVQIYNELIARARLVLGRANDSSESDSSLFTFFVGEIEDSNKKSRTRVRVFSRVIKI
jgi:hypothetical protein